MTLQELIFYCATTENGKRDIEKCYEKGRADAIDEFVDKLFYTPGIDDWDSVLEIAEKMKGISND